MTEVPPQTVAHLNVGQMWHKIIILILFQRFGLNHWFTLWVCIVSTECIADLDKLNLACVLNFSLESFFCLLAKNITYFNSGQKVPGYFNQSWPWYTLYLFLMAFKHFKFWRTIVEKKKVNWSNPHKMYYNVPINIKTKYCGKFC